MWLKKNEWVLGYIIVILQLSQLSTKQAGVVQRVPDEDSNIINRAADDLVGLFFFFFTYLFALLSTNTHIMSIMCKFYVCVLSLRLFSFIHKIFFV